MIYFDNAATTFPKPPMVVDEISRCIKKYCGNPGRSSHALSMRSAEKIYEARQLLGDMFGADVENVIFTYNTTYALNIAIKSFFKLSSHILISNIEHNSVLRPVYELSRKKLCTYDTFSAIGSDDEILENIKNKITPNTSMLICTHVSNICSKRMPIKKIGDFCKSHGIFFIVDGAQSAGLYPINVKEMSIDALCIPGHKSLYGPQGIGAIILSNEQVGRSIIEGGTGINSLELDMPEISPERYEAGTPATPAIAGLCGALKWLNAVESAKIRHYEEDLYCYLKNKLKNNEKIEIYQLDDSFGNTLIFNLLGMQSVFVSEELNKRGICTRSGYHCAPLAHKTLNVPSGGAVRVSFSVYNTKQEISTFYEAIDDILNEKK